MLKYSCHHRTYLDWGYRLSCNLRFLSLAHHQTLRLWFAVLQSRLSAVWWDCSGKNPSEQLNCLSDFLYRAERSGSRQNVVSLSSPCDFSRIYRSCWESIRESWSWFSQGFSKILAKLYYTPVTAHECMYFSATQSRVQYSWDVFYALMTEECLLMHLSRSP